MKEIIGMLTRNAYGRYTLWEGRCVYFYGGYWYALENNESYAKELLSWCINIEEFMKIPDYYCDIKWDNITKSPIDINSLDITKSSCHPVIIKEYDVVVIKVGNSYLSNKYGCENRIIELSDSKEDAFRIYSHNLEEEKLDIHEMLGIPLEEIKVEPIKDLDEE